MKKYKIIISVCLIFILLLSAGCGKSKLQQSIESLENQLAESTKNENLKTDKTDKTNNSNDNKSNKGEFDKEIEDLLKDSGLDLNIQEGVNGSGVPNVPPKNLAKDWESLQFAYDGEVYDWLGKTVKEIKADFVVKTAQVIDNLIEPGSLVDIGFHKDESSEYPSFNLTVLNTNRDDNLTLDDATVVAVSYGDMQSFEYGKGFILPGGYTLYDSTEDVLKGLGKPDVTEGDLVKHYAYLKEDRALVITDGLDRMTNFKYLLFVNPDYVKEVQNATEEFAATFDKESYLNVGGYKFHVDTPFSEVVEKLRLVPANIGDETIVPEEQMIAPGEEATYNANLKGFNNNTIALRLYNGGAEPVSYTGSTVIGMSIQYKIRITNNLYEDMLFTRISPDREVEWMQSRGFSIPVISPLGVKLGEDIEEAFVKIPDDALEKEIKTIEGTKTGFASLEADGMHMKIIGMAFEDSLIIDQIMFTKVLGAE